MLPALTSPNELRIISEREVLGIMGILNILQVLHLVVIVESSEVCRVMESLPISSRQDPQIIFELSEVELIPIDRSISAETLASIFPIKEKIKKYLRHGFYYAHNFELTLNAQRRATLNQQR